LYNNQIVLQRLITELIETETVLFLGNLSFLMKILWGKYTIINYHVALILFRVAFIHFHVLLIHFRVKLHHLIRVFFSCDNNIFSCGIQPLSCGVNPFSCCVHTFLCYIHLIPGKCKCRKPLPLRPCSYKLRLLIRIWNAFNSLKNLIWIKSVIWKIGLYGKNRENREK
jgi:hypothetical protein